MTDKSKQKQKAIQTEVILNQATVEIDKETQEELNKPLVSAEQMDSEDEKFLNEVIEMIDNKKIDLYKTSSLMNESVYEGLQPEAKAQAEIDALNLLNTLRQINKLYREKMTDTYQFKNMLRNFRLTKERIEDQAGDIYII